MKNQISLSQAKISWFNTRNEFFSSLLEESVTNRQVCLMFHACIAFTVLTCSSFTNLLAVVLCFVWFAFSLHLCKKGGIK